MWLESMSPAAFAVCRAASREIDVTALLPDIGVPALVIHLAGTPWGAIELSEELAARIHHARLVVVSELAGAVAAIDEFLGVSPEAETAGGAALASGTAIIMFADIADSTALTERMGDAALRAAARALDERMRAAIGDAGGTPVEGKVLGDGVMAVFTSAREAIDAALRCHALSAESELRLHLGIHAGDVIREDNNVYGGAVNIASRICALSAPGEILVSDVVRGMARSSAGVTFEDRGEREMKGVGEPVHVYAVRREGTSDA
jgi:class 3 adenylate cyclase